jgi:hypothetical protein
VLSGARADAEPPEGGHVTRLGGSRASRWRRDVHAEGRRPDASNIRRDSADVTRAGAAAPPASRRRSRRTADCASARSSS